MKDAPTRTVELRRDVACSACGYNLRGLAVQGRCPECGQEVSVSLAEHVVPDAGAVALDPAWRRQMIEAVVLALLGLGLALASRLDWPEHWRWGRRGPDVPYVLVLAWWALQWYSALKLARRDPAVSGRRRWETVRVWALRAFATVYLAIPLLEQVDFFDAFRVSRWDVLEKLAYAGPLAALAFFFQVRHVFARLAQPVRAAQTTVVAWLVALAAVPDAGYSPSRNLWQDDAIGWPSFQFGWPGLLASAMGDLARGNLGGVRTGWYVAPSVFGVLVLLILLVHLVRAGRRGE